MRTIALRRVSVALKLCSVLLGAAFVWQFIYLTYWTLRPPLVGTLTTEQLIEETRRWLTGWTPYLFYTLVSYAAAKVIDLLIDLARDVRSVAAAVERSRQRREAGRADLAPTAPDPNRHVWSDRPGSIRDGRNLQQPVYDAFGQRVYRGKPKGIRRGESAES